MSIIFVVGFCKTLGSLMRHYTVAIQVIILLDYLELLIAYRC